MGAALRTRVTQLLGIDHPILGGGLMWLSDARYVAALVNAGCMGFITPRSYACEADFRVALALCAELTHGKPYGVKIFETAGHAPAELIKALHKANAVVIHKASSIRHALSAERAGADAIALVGMEEGGHPGMNELPTMLMGALALGQFSVPVVLGGGIGRGKQLAAVLAQGLDGVLIGSRFLVCEEIQAHPRYKEHLLTCDEHSTVRLLQSLGTTWRVLLNDTARQVQAIQQAGATEHAAFGDLISGTVARDRCYAEGEWRHGMVSLGPSIAFAKRLEPLRAIVNCMVDEAAQAIAALHATHSQNGMEQE